MPSDATSNPPMTETIDSANAAASTLFLGQNGEWWDFWLIVSLVLVASAAIAAGITTTGSIVSHKREASAAEQELSRYKLEISEKIAASVAVAESAKGETAHANERIAALNNETARLQADNLSLQKLMQPRRLPPPIVLSATIPTTPPPGFELYKQLADFKGTPFFIQSVPDFEALMLAQDIAGALARAGWQPQASTEPQVPPNLIYDGVTVTTPFVGSPQEPRIRDAAGVLASGLLSLGIKGNSGRPDSNFSPGYRLKSDGTSVMRGYPTFDPPREVVVILVGMRPIPASALVPPK